MGLERAGGEKQRLAGAKGQREANFDFISFTKTFVLMKDLPKEAAKVSEGHQQSDEDRGKNSLMTLLLLLSSLSWCCCC